MSGFESSRGGVSSAPRGDGSKRSGGVKYDTLMDKRVDDERHERQKSNKESINKGSVATVSSTFDAFQRMAAGLEPRTLADNMSNPNRPTWEQYKKDNGDKLDLVGTDMRKMAAYRAQLDRERDERLSGSKRKVSAATSDDDSDNEAEKKKSKKKKSKKEHKKNSKKEKKKSNKKSKDHKRLSDSSSSDTDDEPIRLSDFLRGGVS